MRCPDCNKFVSYDADGDPEIDVEVSEDGQITGTVRIVNACGECGTELKEYTFDVDDSSIVDDVATHHKDKFKHKGKDSDRSLEISDDGGSRTEETVTKDRHGKQIKLSRYMKHLYCAEATFTVTCACGETWEVGWSDNVQASGMDELV